MTTRILEAQSGRISQEIINVAKTEGVSPRFISEGIAKGQIVILKNKLRNNAVALALGDGLKTKVCASLLSDSSAKSLKKEIDKQRVAQVALCDSILDLSVSSNIDKLQNNMLESNLIIGVNPFSKISYEVSQNELKLIEYTKKDMFDLVEKMCKKGVDFLSIHCSLTKNLSQQFKNSVRLSNITSKNAQILFDWIEKTELENPYFRYFDELIEILKKYDVVLHLACAFKPGSINDSFDSLQIAEYSIVSELQKRAFEAGVQVMTDGAGHVSIDKISTLISAIKQMTNKAPMFATTSNACDCAVGYDNISSSIAYSQIVQYGANMINAIYDNDYLSPVGVAQFKKGIMIAKIAAHCGDIAKNNVEAIKQNYKISYARKNENWKNIIKNSIDKTVFEGIGIKK